MSESATACSRRARSKTSWLGSISLCFLLANALQGEDGASLQDLFGISGSARTAFFTKDSSFVDAPGVECDSLWITARPHPFDGIATFVDARVQCQLVSGNSTVNGDLREAYSEITLGPWDLKAGRQITVWGRADKINPTDVWSVRDYKLLATDDDDQQLGALEVQSSWSWGAYQLVSIWQPEWRPPVLPIPPFPTGTSISDVGVRDNADQWGVKMDHSGSGADWSLSYAHTIDRTPNLTLLSLHPQGDGLGLSFVEEDMVGADLAVPLGDYGFRGEVAYLDAHNEGGQNPLAQDSNAFAVLGVERTWAGAFNVNAQFLFKSTPDFHRVDEADGPGLESLALEEEVISNQLASNLEGASVRLDYKALNETLETEVAAVMWFTKRDSILTGKVTYAFTDRVKGIVGANRWGGPVDSYFGQLRRTSAGFVEIRYGF